MIEDILDQILAELVKLNSATPVTRTVSTAEALTVEAGVEETFVPTDLSDLRQMSADAIKAELEEVHGVEVPKGTWTKTMKVMLADARAKQGQNAIEVEAPEVEEDVHAEPEEVEEVEEVEEATGWLDEPEPEVEKAPETKQYTQEEVRPMLMTASARTSKGEVVGSIEKITGKKWISLAGLSQADMNSIGAFFAEASK